MLSVTSMTIVQLSVMSANEGINEISSYAVIQYLGYRAPLQLD